MSLYYTDGSCDPHADYPMDLGYGATITEPWVSLCMYVRMYVCMYVCMYVFVKTHAGIYV
jgi:hypothetical protein